MTTTTKIFVILVCLFSFILTPLVISYAAQKENWRRLANDSRSELNIAYAGQQSALAILTAEADRFAALQKQEQSRYLDLQQQYVQLQRQLADLTQDRDQLARSRDDWETSACLLTAEMTIKTKHNQELTEAKESALARERDLQARNLQLADRVKELDAQVVVLTQKLRQEDEVIAVMRQENVDFRRGTGFGQAGPPLTASPTPTAQAAGPAAASPIRGSVTRVEGTLATIDVGSAAGVRPEMLMVVLRDGGYVCDLEITSQVTPTEAVGKIVVYNTETDKRIQPGDKIEDSESFARQ